ncbi:basic proline-rich protein-like isoform X4 [Canis lupus familiaris]|uniref:basic proline-rich protein-like isoform X4 n=1 Tax=Canis lupus familiaris TaxID=9615 RepID=UPI0018F317F2|nr:basic proline-rich protein-like isoform X4 [Canis lupus familiaris]
MGRRRPAECGSALPAPTGTSQRQVGAGSKPAAQAEARASQPPARHPRHPPPRGVCPGGREQVRARSPWEPPAPGGEPTGATPESESPAGTRGPPTGAGTAPGRPEDGPGMNCGKNQEDSRWEWNTLSDLSLFPQNAKFLESHIWAPRKTDIDDCTL